MKKTYIFWLPDTYCNSENNPLSSMNCSSVESAKKWAVNLAKINKKSVFFKSVNGRKVYTISNQIEIVLDNKYK